MYRLPRNLRRLTRPALALVLVFAQAVAAFGFPLVRSKAEAVKACGCVVACGTTPDCCCTPPPPPAPPPSPPACPHCAVEVESEPACPKCKAKEAAKPACGHCLTTATAAQAVEGVTWVSAVKARQCRGEGPQGLLAEVPAVPPVASAIVHAQPLPTSFPPPADTGRAHFATDPSDPPPRG